MNKNTVLCSVAIIAASMQVLADAPGPGGIEPQNTTQMYYLPSANYLQDGVNVFMTADYILWKWDQTLATTDLLTSDDAFDDQFINRTSKVCLFNPKYHSGFQVGLGLALNNVDDWQFSSEYTWFKSQNDTTIETAPNQAFRRYYGDQFLGYYQHGYFRKQGTIAFNDLDLLIKKSFYISKTLAACLSTGIKNLWIDTHLYTNYDAVLERFGAVDTVVSNAVGVSSQKSWGIGPKFDFSFDWLFGYGIKLKGGIGGSILYTDYTWKGGVKATLAGTPFESTFTKSNKEHYFVPITESTFGLAWGTYLYDKAYHIDLSASYDFNIYWNYTKLGQTAFTNMQMSGLNLQARFDF